ncbi:hypothetical protein AMTRI_Chr11g96760 [Amborella trichopoda]
MRFHALLRPQKMDSFLFLGKHTRFVTTKRMMKYMSYRDKICNLLSSCLAGKNLPPWSVERLIHLDRHESSTTLHCQNPSCIFESAPPLSPRPQRQNVGLGPTVHHERKDSPSRDH